MAHAISTPPADLVDDECPPSGVHEESLYPLVAVIAPTAESTGPNAAYQGTDVSQDGSASEPLLHAIVLQRPISELAELVAILNDAGQVLHAQEILDIAAALRPVEDLAAIAPHLNEAQAAETLHTAAHRRPVEELARLVVVLNESGQCTHARQILHTTAAHRPVSELAQLVGHLHGTSDTESQAQSRWKLRR